jgi:hypothetical protein
MARTDSDYRGYYESDARPYNARESLGLIKKNGRVKQNKQEPATSLAKDSEIKGKKHKDYEDYE